MVLVAHARELRSESLEQVPTRTPEPDYSPVTWAQLSSFLASDHTNWHPYIAGKYTCANYAIDLVANARARNMQAWIVIVTFDFSGPGHAFVAFKTTDRGVVWIEPQTDYAYNEVGLGKPLCLTINTSVCQKWGNVLRIIQPAQCDPVTSECWAQ